MVGRVTPTILAMDATFRTQTVGNVDLLSAAELPRHD